MNPEMGKGRIITMLAVFLAVAAVFCVQLVRWQIFSNDYYEEMALTSTEYRVETEAVRGEIYDRNGIGLAVNLTGYRVLINKLSIKEEEINAAINRLVEIFSESHEQWTDELPIKINAQNNYYFEKDREEDIRQLKSKNYLNMNPYSTAEDCMIKLAEKYDCQDYDKVRRRNIVSVRYSMEQNGFSFSKPYIFADKISDITMMAVSENMQDMPGVITETAAVRTYTNGTVAPHILGVTGLISAEEYKEFKNKGYAYTDIIGKSGIEAAFEKNLRGTAGYKSYEKTSDNQITEVSGTEARPGDSIYLTIDADLQQTAQKALETAVKEANQYAAETKEKYTGEDCVGAAMVVLNIKDFSVLCAANYPTYDNAKYYEDYTKLSQAKGVPLFDRAFMGALAPGSTFKPLVASAALQEKVITANTVINCNGVYTENGLNLHCMSIHGGINLFDAIKDSCNVYFAEAGKRLGIEKLDEYALRCGLGVKTGIEIQESSGTIAGPKYSEAMGSEWYSSFVSPAAIGQSDNQFTPLQLAVYAATIANNGVRLKPHVVDKIVSYHQDEVKYQSEAEVIENMGISAGNLKSVQKAMNLAASNYEPFLDFGIQIAGKTGTAENSGSDHANFICYAPYDKPEIAIAVMVEHGGKSRVAMNAAKKVLTAYFTKNGQLSANKNIKKSSESP